jgi:hypothetical protein
MSELKTKPTNASALKFIKSIPDERRKKDGLVLLDMFKKATGEKPRIWGTSIVGFGMYHYKSERSTQEGDWPLVGFSPRKQNLALYLGGLDEFGDELKKLGKHKRSVACLYINKLDDVDLKVLERLITKSFKLMKKKYRSK